MAVANLSGHRFETLFPANAKRAHSAWSFQIWRLPGDGRG